MYTFKPVGPLIWTA